MPKQNIPFPSVTVCPAGIGIFKTDMRKAVANQLQRKSLKLKIPEKIRLFQMEALGMLITK